MKKSSYQERMRTFVNASFLYGAASGIALYFDKKDITDWIFWSTLFLCYQMAIGFDAIYDSLSEDIHRRSR